MGVVFSCLSSAVLLVGQILESLCLAAGEILSVLVRAVFTVIITVLDVLAALTCCWRVPYDDRPSRETYVFANVATNIGSVAGAGANGPAGPLAGSGHGILRSWLTKDGRAARKQVQNARKAEEALKKSELKSNTAVDV